MKLDKIIGISFLYFCSVFGQNLNYAVHDMHTLVPYRNHVDFSYEYILMNDTVDILKMKESEFGANTKFDAIGDLTGNKIKIRYGILDDLMLQMSLKKENLQYSSSTIVNEHKDVFLRYNIFNHQYARLNSGLSIDVGYETNKLKDFYFRNLTEINTLGNKVINEQNIIRQITDNNDPILSNGDYYIFNTTTADPNDKIKLDGNNFNSLISALSISDMWIALKNVSDESQYIRLLTGFYDNKYTSDFYVGFKKTTIKGLITTTNEILDYANKIGQNVEQSLSREEKMYIAGFNYTLESKDLIYEFGFEYDKFIREKSLDYIDFNYIFDLDIAYKFTKNTLLYAGAKIMYRQLNGQIPYLYNEYTQTSYDHKYGYAKFGVQYRF